MTTKSSTKSTKRFTAPVIIGAFAISTFLAPITAGMSYLYAIGHLTVLAMCDQADSYQ